MQLKLIVFLVVGLETLRLYLGQGERWSVLIVVMELLFNISIGQMDLLKSR